jgi:hypothetical protein
MHRSGTSLTASLIRELGIDFGSEDTMIPAHSVDNPISYLEQRAMVAVNEQLLELMGGSWRNPPTLPPGWQHSPGLEPLYAEAAAAVAHLFPGGVGWGWKDPRTSLTLPFWREVIGPMDYVVCVRRPGDTALSVSTRYGRGLRRALPVLFPRFRKRHWVELWLRYTQDALRHTEGEHRIVVSYEGYHRDPARVLASLREFLGLVPAGEDDHALDVVRPELWRSRSANARLGPDYSRAAEIYDAAVGTSPSPH